MKVMPRLSGGPRQVSLKLKASEPSLRRAVVPVGKPSRVFGEAAVEPAIEGNGERHIELEPAVETFEAVGSVFEQGEMPAEAVGEPVAQTEWFAPQPEQSAIEIPEPVVTQVEEITVPEIQPVFAEAATITQPEIEPFFAQAGAVAEAEIEPVGQGQPIPQLTPVEEPSIIEVVTEPEPAGFDALRQPSEPSVEPVFESPIYEPTTPVNMPEPIQIPTAPAGRGGAPHPAGAMQTAVQLSFAFEIASMQLTPTFKMGALQLRPSSKIVTMRLAGSAPQPAMNLQVTFEIARIQPAGGTLGSF